MPIHHDTRARDPRAQDLRLEEKCRLLGGASTWRTHAIERAGVPAIKMSDGPNGVRGEGLGATSTPGVVIPAGIMVGATWDRALARELGDLLGREARRKTSHVLLAPTVNLQRTPVGGRVFECMSEDPELTAGLAVPYIRGVQSHGVAVTVKHFAVNDTEVDRMSVDVDVDEVTLRELYLRPFEAAVVEAEAWGIMSAYNKVAGEHCADNARLLTDILRREWDFDGFVVSDWFGSHDTVGSATAGLDVAMPGPHTIYGDRLLAAVQAGEVDEAVVDALVDDLFLLIERTEADGRSADEPETTVDDAAERDLCRRAVTGGLVLAKNDGALPLRGGTSVALIGPNASDTRIMGGGSASLQPMAAPTIAEALAARVPDLTHEPGVRIDRLAPPMTVRTLRTPDGEPGLRVDYRNGHDPAGEVVVTETANRSMLRFFGSTPTGVDAAKFHLSLTGTFVPEVSGPHTFSAVMTGGGRITVGDSVVFDDPNRDLPRGPLFFGLASVEQQGVVDCVAGEPVEVAVGSTGLAGFCGVRLGVHVPEPEDLFERAVAAAEAADTAVVVVGTNDEWETEGEDRDTIALPGDQDELVRRVAAVQANTVVIVNSGGPVSMPWVDDVAAVLIAPFGGQELGPGIADVLVGDTDPGGRLPITHPRALEDTPAWPWYAPVEGIQHYGEGLLMGYRGFDANGTEPLFPFGHGLSYGTTEWGAPAVASTEVDAAVGISVSVPVASVGDRDATVVVQGYVAEVDRAEGQPPKRLAGWTKRVVPAGTSEDVVVTFPPTAFRRWDTETATWRLLEGPCDLVIARSAGDEVARVRIDLVHV